jgi:hypothetical protein
MNAVPEIPARPGPTILRVPAVRWMVAELVPFGCLAIGFAIAREWRPVIALGYLIALFGMPVLTAFYLYKVLCAAIGWVVPLIPLSIATTWAGAVTIVGSAIGRSPQDPGGTTIEATTSWLIAIACLAAIVAGIVAAAILNGERWMRHNRNNLPRNKFEAYAQSRGTLAWLWLPR